MQALALRLIGTPIETRDFLPLLKWMIVTGVTLFGLLAAWHYGYLQFMIGSDRSYITLCILALYAFFSVHCLMLTVGISREINGLHRVQRQISYGNDVYRIVDGRVVIADGSDLIECKLTEHIRHLITMSRLQGNARLDQTLLLRRVADSLRNRQSIGWFVADAMLKLGLLGTVIGFILMLSSVKSIDSFDVETLKGALSSMSGGMGVALFTTLFGLVGGILLKVQYYMLDAGTSYLFGLITEVTEVYVVPVLNRGASGAV